MSGLRLPCGEACARGGRAAGAGARRPGGLGRGLCPAEVRAPGAGGCPA